MIATSVPRQFPKLNRLLGSRTFATYKQGQNSPLKPKIREYFYYIDHNGMLFLDDSRMKNFTSCFKEKSFLNFFFRNIKPNRGERYKEDFPYISLCGVERNYIRCDDVPIVFTHLVPIDASDYKLVIAYSDLWHPFVPQSLYMLPDKTSKHAGRIYHKAEDKFGGYGLIRSQLAQEIEDYFVFDQHKQPTRFRWKDGQTYELSGELAHKFEQ